MKTNLKIICQNCFSDVDVIVDIELETEYKGYFKCKTCKNGMDLTYRFKQFKGVEFPVPIIMYD